MVGSESFVLVRIGTRLGFIAADYDIAAVQRLRVGRSLFKLSMSKSA